MKRSGYNKGYHDVYSVLRVSELVIIASILKEKATQDKVLDDEYMVCSFKWGNSS